MEGKMPAKIQNNNIPISAYWRSDVDKTKVSSALKQLSTAYGVDYSAKDAAFLSTSKDVDRELMRIELLRLEKEELKINDARSMTQTAERALTEIMEKLNQISSHAEASVQVGRTDRAELAAQAHALVKDVDRIARETRYDGQYLLEGSLSDGLGIGVYDQDGTELILQIDSARAADLGLTSGSTPLKEIFSGGAADIDTQEGAEKALEILDHVKQDVKSMLGNINGFQKFLADQSETNEKNIEKTTALKSSVSSMGSGNTSSEYIRNQLLMDSSRAILAQANLSPQSVLSLLGF